jgi:hypothetical protein
MKQIDAPARNLRYKPNPAQYVLWCPRIISPPKPLVLEKRPPILMWETELSPEPANKSIHLSCIFFLAIHLGTAQQLSHEEQPRALFSVSQCPRGFCIVRRSNSKQSAARAIGKAKHSYTTAENVWQRQRSTRRRAWRAAGQGSPGRQGRW